MIDAVALANGQVYSVTRTGGVSHVVKHTRRQATSLYSTKDKLPGLWVSPQGNIHAVGKRHHTNASGSWKAGKLPEGGFSLWGRDEEVFVGGNDGLIGRWDGATWDELGNLGDLVAGISGSSTEVFFGGFAESLARWDGESLTESEVGLEVQGVLQNGSEVLLCSTDALYRLTGEGEPERLAETDEELYGVGVGKRGVFVHAGWQILKLEDGAFELDRDNDDDALMAKRATYSTAITSDGELIVAGGAKSVLVDSGEGFIEWPALRT